MSLNIVQDFIPAGRRNRPGIRLDGPRYITIHDTANPRPGADALAHARYLKSDSAANLPVSWHFTVDDTRVVQHLPLDEVGWHAGDGRDGPGNRSSIAIELCEVGDRARVEANAAALVADLLRRFGLPVSAVVQHNRWTGKNCPRILRGRPGGWEHFISVIEERLRPAEVPAPPQPQAEDTPILGPPQVTLKQARAYLARVAPGWEDIADHTWTVAPVYGVRPEVALALMLHETGRFQFGGDVRPEQNNFGGIGATGGGARGASFASRLTGVTAVVQHLYAYASAAPLPAGIEQVDPRFHLVRRGSAPTLEALGGKWAVPGYDKVRFASFEEAFAANGTYGQVIRDRYLLPLLATTAPEATPADQYAAVPEWARSTARKLKLAGWLNSLEHGPDFWAAMVVADRAGIWDKAGA